MKKLLLIATTLLSFYFIARPALAKDFSFPNVSVDIQINKDGSFDYVENRTYDFSGSFSWADIWIPTKVTRGRFTYNTVISDFQVLDGNQLLNVETEEQNNKFYAKWYYSSQNEQKTFTISYTVKNGITEYLDIAELYWQVVGNEWEKGIDNIEILVHLPQATASKDEIKVFGHGPLSGYSEILDTQTTRFIATNVLPKQFVEIRVLFPPELVAGVPSTKQNLASILAEEEKFVQQTIAAAKRVQQQQRIISTLVVVFLIASPLIFLTWLFVWYKKWKKVGEDYKFADIPRYIRELPSDLPPALVDVLQKEGGKPSSTAFTATIFNLARRHFLEIQDETEAKSGFFGAKVKYHSTLKLKKPEVLAGEKTEELKNRETESLPAQAGLKEYERDILEFIFMRIGKSVNEVKFEEITKYLKKHPTTFQKWFGKWQEKVQKEGEKLGFMEQEGEKEYKRFAWLTVLPAILSPLIIPVAIFAIPALKRRKLTWAKEEALWKAFKRFLDDFSKFKEIPPEAYKLWEHYLVFGVLFGNAEKILKMLPIILQDPQAAQATWYVSSTYPTITADSVNAMSSSINAFASQLASASTSAAHYSSGGGGGFSGGGGGGAG